ncbi:hypothetical protein FHQ08_11945 [Lactobacillus sp. CC-MHH1034]|uniref:hypothetical protein n=1 Tax=Agrilactobacillus fermenti TaxID=2586909 RepID=UPI001E58E90B|nr:hypothetical protein [Agrilactobacillus fermenti]MCD2257398.1 hypothetical protein [Agrilactobacillus fermenti]
MKLNMKRYYENLQYRQEQKYIVHIVKEEKVINVHKKATSAATPVARIKSF